MVVQLPPLAPPSPIDKAFGSIQQCPADKVNRLRWEDRELLFKAEENPLEYTLARQEDADEYVRILLVTISEVSGPMNAETSHVSKLSSEDVSDEQDVQRLLFADPVGVWTHFALTRLYEVLVCLHEGSRANASIASTFYRHEEEPESGLFSSISSVGKLSDNVWRPLIRLLHLGGPMRGDPFVRRAASLCIAIMIMAAMERPTVVASPRVVRRRKKNNGAPPRTIPTLSLLSIDQPMLALISWIASQLQSSTGSRKSLDLVTPTLSMLLGHAPQSRNMFQTSGGIGYLSKHILSSNGSGNHWNHNKKGGGSATAQQQYDLCFCLWTMTLTTHEDSSQGRNASNKWAELESDRLFHLLRDGAVPALVEIVKSSPREKTIRVGLAALVNLATSTTTDAIVLSAADSDDDDFAYSGKKSHNTTKASSYLNGRVNGSEGGRRRRRPVNAGSFCSEMIGCGLLRVVDWMMEAQRPLWTDPDMVTDVETLHRALHQHFHQVMSTSTRAWDLYVAQVRTGRLEWDTMLHTERFFRENARKMELNDFHIVKMLIRCLDRSDDDEDVAAVACFDLGEFMRHYPNGRAIARRLGARERLMILLDSSSSDLRQAALQAVSKLLVKDQETYWAISNGTTNASSNARNNKK